MEQLAPNTPLTKNANVGGVGTQKSSQNGQGTRALQNIFLFRSCLKAIYTSCQYASDSHTFKPLYNMARQILCAKKLGKKEIIGSGICLIHIYTAFYCMYYINFSSNSKYSSHFPRREATRQHICAA